MFGVVVFLCAAAAGSGSLLDYQEWPATVSHQSKVEIHPSLQYYPAPLVSQYGAEEHFAPLEPYGSSVYSVPLVSQYGAAIHSAPLVPHYGSTVHSSPLVGYGDHGVYGSHSGADQEHHLYKRSAHFAPVVEAALLPVTAHVFPAAVSHQSRVDVHHSTPLHPYTYHHGYPTPFSPYAYAPKEYVSYGYNW